MPLTRSHSWFMDWDVVETTYGVPYDPTIEKLVGKALRVDPNKCIPNDLESTRSPFQDASPERRVCVELFESIRHSAKHHFGKLDNILRKYCQVHLIGAKPNLTWSVSLLTRLPRVPASTIQLYKPYCDPQWDTQWKGLYLLPKAFNVSEDSVGPVQQITEAARRRSQMIRSCRLQVVRNLNSTTILTALGVSAPCERSNESKHLTLRKVVGYTNWLASLTEEAIMIYSHSMGSQYPYGPRPNSWASKHLSLHNLSDDPAKAQSRHVVILFLWTAWQRSVMLILYYNIFNRLYNQEAVDPFADLSIGGNFMFNCYLRSDLLEKHRVPQYMCPWALSLIRSRRTNAGSDVRRLLCRYQAQFCDDPPRCIPVSRRQCKGTSPEEC